MTGISRTIPSRQWGSVNSSDAACASYLLECRDIALSFGIRMLCGIGNQPQEGKYFLGQLFQVNRSASSQHFPAGTRRVITCARAQAPEASAPDTARPDCYAVLSALVGGFIRSFQPRDKARPRFIGQHLHSGKRALWLSLAKFRI